VLNKAGQWLDRVSRERSQRLTARDMLAASPTLRDEYFAAVRGFDRR
jgi:hypothetical protein